MKLVMIRGCSGSGKTTLMKSFIKRHDMKLRSVENIAFMQSGPQIVLGDYTKAGCVGCDRYRDVDDIKRHLAFLRDAFAPEVMLFEHMLLSTTYKYSCDLIRMFGKRSFGCIFLDLPFNQIVKNIRSRNEGKPFSTDKVYANYVRARNSLLKLQYGGVYVLRVNPFDYAQSELSSIVDGFIENWPISLEV